jgi:magnesium transporter
VIDERGRLLDDIRLRQLLLGDPVLTIHSLMDSQVVSLKALDDREEAVRVMERYDLATLPVVGSDGALVGIVTFDDIADVAEKEVTEDIQKLAAVEAFEEPYLTLPLRQLVRKRGTWLAMLFVGEMLTASAMSHFQGEIEKAVVLALFVPLIISSGGNSGSQASTLVIRALAVGEIEMRDWARVLRRELVCGLALGALLAVLGMLRICLWQVFGWADYTAHYVRVGIVVAAALIGVVIWGTFIGGMLPLFLRKLRLDPATVSAPFVATAVDVSGLAIYFSVALLVLKGTLL